MPVYPDPKDQQRYEARVLEQVTHMLNLFDTLGGFEPDPGDFWAYAEAELAPAVVTRLRAEPYLMAVEPYQQLFNAWYARREVTRLLTS